MRDCSSSCAVSPFLGNRWVVKLLRVLVPGVVCGALAFPAGYGQTGYISTIAGVPAFPGGGYTGDGGPAKSAKFQNPWGVSTDSNGNLYIADTFNNVVRRIDAKTGIVTTVAGNGYGAGFQPGSGAHLGGYTGDGGPATSAELDSPDFAAVDSGGNLYISDTSNHVVRRVDATTHVITTIAGDGVYGYTGDKGRAVAARLHSPTSLAFDSSGNLYIADQYNNAIRKIDIKTGIITTVAGTGTPGSSGDGGPATSAQLLLPTGLAFDGAGNMYFSVFDCRIRKVAAATGVISTVAGVANKCGYAGDGGPAVSANLNDPTTLGIDGAGNVFFSDVLNYLVRKVDVKTGIISRVAGTRTFGFSGDGGPATSANISMPTGVALDDSGNLCFSDSMYNVIRKVQSVGATRPAPTPVFMPPPGTFTTPQSVTITDFNRSAVIHYTLNGTTPTASSATYTTAIPVSSTVTIKAIAVLSGRPASAVATGTYTILTPALTPMIKPVGGSYGIAQLITITAGNLGATLYYTTDGTTPTTSSTKYTVPFGVTRTTQVRAFATAPGHTNSAVASAVYAISPAASLLTSPATSIGTAQATLHALTNTFGATATVWFVYGTSSTAMTSSTVQSILPGATPHQGFDVTVTGLKSKTTYYFQPRATTIGGTASGAIASFTTN